MRGQLVWWPGGPLIVALATAGLEPVLAAGGDEHLAGAVRTPPVAGQATGYGASRLAGDHHG